jgi:hypothetical protein
MSDKKRIAKDYEALPEDVKARLKLSYADGFETHLVSYYNKEGVKISALPFDTEDIYYLVRMTMDEARQIIEEDEDYDEEGHLRDNFETDYFGEGEEHQDDEDEVEDDNPKKQHDDDDDYED